MYVPESDDEYSQAERQSCKQDSVGAHSGNFMFRELASRVEHEWRFFIMKSLETPW